MKPPDYRWWIQHAHEDSAFLRLIRNPESFTEAIRGRLEAVGRDPNDVGLHNMALWRAIFEQHRFGGLSSILDSIQPAPTYGDDVRPMTGDLRIDSRAIRDDVGPFPALGVSCFWAPYAYRHNPDHLDRFALWAVQSGCSYARIFGAMDWSGATDPAHIPNYIDMMEGTITALALRGLRSQITLFTRRYQIPNPEHYTRIMAQMIQRNREKVILTEIGNEGRHEHNNWQFADLRCLATTFREHSDAPLAITAPISGTKWGPIEEQLREINEFSDATATTIHYPRLDTTAEGQWRAVRQPWHAHVPVGGCPRFTVNNEPARWDRLGSKKDVSAAVAMQLVAFITGHGMSCHHDVYGVAFDAGEYSTDEQSQQFKLVMSTVMPLLPPDIANWVSVRVGFGRHPFEDLEEQHWTFHDDISDGVSRCYAAQRHTSFVMVLAGVRGEVRLEKVQPQRYQVRSLSTGEVCYVGHGPYAVQEKDGCAFLVQNVNL